MFVQWPRRAIMDLRVGYHGCYNLISTEFHVVKTTLHTPLLENKYDQSIVLLLIVCSLMADPTSTRLSLLASLKNRRNWRRVGPLFKRNFFLFHGIES